MHLLNRGIMDKNTLNLILTILMLTIVLGIILFLIFDSLSTYKKKLDSNLFDKEIKAKLHKESKKYLDNRNRVIKISGNNSNITINASTFKYSKYDSPYVNVLEYSKNKLKKENKKKVKTKRIIIDSIFTIFIVLLVGMNIYTRATDTLLSINNKTYVTVASGSMESKNEANTYLETYSLDNQIKTFSLIELEKLNKEDEISLYDICAYKDKTTSKLIIHRVIKIQEKNGTIYYTFRGDSNDLSDYYLVTRDQILYKYSGYSSYGLGLVISYLNNYIGLITIIYCIIALYCIDYSYGKRIKLYDAKLDENIARYNKEEINKLGKTKYIYIP